MSDARDRARHEVIRYSHRIQAEHLVYSTAGNVSTRVDGEPEVIAMTPTSLAYDALEHDDICIVSTSGELLEGRREPTSELPLHTLVYARRPEVGAIIHTHSPAAMTMAVLGWRLPPILTGLVEAVGGDVKVAPYSRPTTPEMADYTAEALSDRGACFMRHHGLLAIGSDLANAFFAASVTEGGAKVYLDARAQGVEVPELGDDDVAFIAATSALKAVLAGPERGVVAVAEHGYAMHRPHPGWAENDPEDWVRAAAQAVPELLARGGIAAGDVAAVCIVSQRDIAALIDESGEPLGRCIHWSDRRDPDETVALFDQLGRDRLLETCGTDPIPGLLLPNLVWIARHEPGLFTRAYAALGPKDYVAYRLTGEIATDRTTPTRSLLNDWRREDWSDELCQEVGLPRGILPPVRYSPWELRAVLDQRAARIGLTSGTLLVAGGGDDPSAALGCGVTDPGELSIGSSSSTSWRVVADRPSITPGCPLGVLPHVVPGRYLHEMVAVGTGTSLRWFREALASHGAAPGAYDDVLAQAAAVAPGAGGVLFYPYVEGATIPYEDDRVRAAFLGIETHHTRGHLARAIVEAIAYQYPPTIEIVEQAGHEVAAITISDGEARSAIWNQIKADVMNRPLRVAAVPEAPAVGAAILAGMAADVFASADAGVAALTRPADVVLPDPDSHRLYEPLRRRWEAVRAHVFAAAAVEPGVPEALSRP